MHVSKFSESHLYLKSTSKVHSFEKLLSCIQNVFIQNQFKENIKFPFKSHKGNQEWNNQFPTLDCVI